MRKFAPVLWCLAAAALFGASTPASKALLDGVGPLALAGLLYLGAAAATLPFSFRGGSPVARRSPANVRRVVLAVLFGGGLGPVLLLLGLRLAPASSVALWLNFEAVATAILGGLLFREHLSPRVLLAVALVVAAGALLAAPEGLGGPAGALLVAGACVCWGLDNHLTSLVDGFTPAQTTCLKGAFAGTVNLGLALAIEGFHLPPGTAAAAAGVGALSYGASIALYIRGAQHLGATRSQLLFSTSPFLGTAASWLFLAEPVLPVQIAAAAVMAGAILLLVTARHAHEHRHEPTVHTHSHRHDDSHHDHRHDGVPVWTRHTHEHAHEPIVHAHAHEPDLAHRHEHRDE